MQLTMGNLIIFIENNKNKNEVAQIVIKDLN